MLVDDPEECPIREFKAGLRCQDCVLPPFSWIYCLWHVSLSLFPCPVLSETHCSGLKLTVDHAVVMSTLRRGSTHVDCVAFCDELSAYMVGAGRRSSCTLRPRRRS